MTSVYKNQHIVFEKNPLGELDFLIQSMKQRLCNLLEMIRQRLAQQINESVNLFSHGCVRTSKLSFNVEALEHFEKTLSSEIATLKFKLLSGGQPFSPSVIKTIQIPMSPTIGFNYGANSYNSNHNMIISCPSNGHVHFFDATTFTPMTNRQTRELTSSVVQMSYWPETDSYLMGCAKGEIYQYGASNDSLTEVMKKGSSFVLAITHLDEQNYFFSTSNSNKIYYANVNSRDARPLQSKDADCWFLHHHKEKKLLFCGLANGQISIYNTAKRDRFPLVLTFQAHKPRAYVTIIKCVKVNGKEYLVTGGNDSFVKIWHINKDKVKLLKIITNQEHTSNMVFLENYQMIASTHHQDYIKFFKIPFGTLEATLPFDLKKIRSIFLMKEKNMIGVGDLSQNSMKIIRLNPSDEIEEENPMVGEA